MWDLAKGGGGLEQIGATDHGGRTARWRQEGVRVTWERATDGQMGDMGAAEFDVWETHVRDTEWRAEESR